MRGLISIIVPVYNMEQYLPKCVDSLLAQTYENIEIILVDDGSTDTSGKICDEYQAKSEKIVVLHTANRGLSAARNAGLDVAEGTYIGFVDSDDWVEPEMFERLYRLITENAADLSVCAMKEDFDRGTIQMNQTEGFRCLTREQLFEDIIVNETVYGYACNKLFKRDVIGASRFDETLTSQEDMDFSMRYAQKCASAVCTDAEYYHYRQRIDSMTGELNYSPRKLSVMKVYERAFPVYAEFCPQCLPVIERNYLKINTNILGRMKVSKIENPALENQLTENAKRYYPIVMGNRELSVSEKVNIFLTYHFPKQMLLLKQMVKKKKYGV